MSADFDAGSIEGRLTLDTSAFREGLRLAKADAEEFERNPIKIKVELDTLAYDAKKAELDADRDALNNDLNAKVNLDIGDALAKIATVKLAMASLGGDKNLDIASRSSLVRGAESAAGDVLKDLEPGRHRGPSLLERLLGIGGRGFTSFRGSLSGASSGITTGLGTFGAGAAAAAMPTLIGTGVLGGLALLPQLAAAGAALGAFSTAALVGATTIGIAAKGYMSLVKNDLADLKKHPGMYGAAGRNLIDAQKDFGEVQDAFQRRTMGGVIGVVTGATNLAAGVLPRLVPIVNTISHGLEGVIGQIHSLTDTRLFQSFLGSVQGFLGGFLKGAGPDITMILGTMMHFFIGMRPVMAELGGTMNNLIYKSTEWINSFVAGGGLTKAAAGFKTQFMPILDVLGAVVKGLWQISLAIAPVRAPLLDFLGKLAGAIAGLDWHSLATSVGQLLTALTPIIPVLGQMANGFIHAFGAVVALIAPVIAWIGNLMQHLGPLNGAVGAVVIGIVALNAALNGFVGVAGGVVNSAKGVMSALRLLPGGPATALGIAAIGVAAYGVYKYFDILGHQFDTTAQQANDAYKTIGDAQGLKDANAAARALLGTLDQVTGAYTQASRAALANELKSGGALSGLAKDGARFGLSQRQIASMLLGSGGKQTQDLMALQQSLNTRAGDVNAQAMMRQTNKGLASSQYAASLGPNYSADAMDKWSRAYDAQTAKINKQADALRAEATAITKFNDNIQAEQIGIWASRINNATTEMQKLGVSSAAAWKAWPGDLKIALDRDTYNMSMGSLERFAASLHSKFPKAAAGNAAAIAQVLVLSDPSIPHTMAQINAVTTALLGLGKVKPPPIKIQVLAADALRAINSVVSGFGLLSGLGGSGKGPGHAYGGTIPYPAYANGGLTTALVGERGPELAQLPPGTRIIPAGQTRQTLGDMSAASQAPLNMMVALLAQIAANSGSPADMVDALTTAFANAQEKAQRAAIQAARAGGGN